MTAATFPTTLKISIPSHLNMMTAPFLWADLEEKLLPNTMVILDMAKTKFVDNNGIQILNKAVEHSKAVKAQLKFVGMNQSVKIRLMVGGVLRQG
jgi:anti-anti-sigma regulatory factor